jgi:hypothetical protein
VVTTYEFRVRTSPTAGGNRDLIRADDALARSKDDDHVRAAEYRAARESMGELDGTPKAALGHASPRHSDGRRIVRDQGAGTGPRAASAVVKPKRPSTGTRLP